MAILLEFINFVVPIQRIQEIYQGGWDAFLDDNSRSIGKVTWHDDHLFRTGTMDPDLMDDLIAKWTKLGFVATELIEGKQVWKDFCVVTSYGVSQYNCPWITVDPARRSAWHSGMEQGDTIGREHF